VILVDLQTLFGYLTPVSLTIGVIYHIMTLRNTRKNQELSLKAQEHALETRQVQLFMNVYSRFDNPVLMNSFVKAYYQEWSDFDDWFLKYGPQGDIDGHASWIFLNNSIQGIGVLVRKNLVDVGIVYDLMGTMVALHWEKAEPLVRGMRERFQVKMYNDVEFLYNELRKYGENQPELQA
jgi:hypothetical protein